MEENSGITDFIKFDDNKILKETIIFKNVQTFLYVSYLEW